jgi:hypothetical protein
MRSLSRRALALSVTAVLSVSACASDTTDDTAATDSPVVMSAGQARPAPEPAPEPEPEPEDDPSDVVLGAVVVAVPGDWLLDDTDDADDTTARAEHGDPCHGTADLDELARGTHVEVHGPDGDLVGTARLAQPTVDTGPDDDRLTCVAVIDVDVDTPDGDATLLLTVGDLPPLEFAWDDYQEQGALLAHATRLGVELAWE